MRSAGDSGLLPSQEHSACRLGSARQPAAVNGECVAMDIGGGARCQEHGRAANVVGVAPAAGGDALLDLAVARFVGLQRGSVVGGDIARRDGVYIDAPGRPFVCEQLGEAGDAALRRRDLVVAAS